MNTMATTQANANADNTASRPTVDALLAAPEQEAGAWIPADMQVVGDEYVIRIPKSIPKSALKVSSTGKSLITTFRVELGRGTLPMLVQDGDAKIALDFRSFNFTLAFPRKAR